MIRYRVQHVAGRDAPLGRCLSSMPLRTELVVDGPASDPNPWRGYRRCLQNLGDATHVLVVQDDTIACRNLEHVVPLLAAARPDTLTSLFVGGLPGRNAREFWRALGRGQRWIRLENRAVVHVVALLWPVPLAQELLGWAETARLPGHRGVTRSDDEVVGTFVRLTKRPVFATVPCLIEHPDDVPSTCHRRAAGGADRGRVALSWIGPEADPTELDWTAA